MFANQCSVTGSIHNKICLVGGVLQESLIFSLGNYKIPVVDPLGFFRLYF